MVCFPVLRVAVPETGYVHPMDKQDEPLRCESEMLQLLFLDIFQLEIKDF